MSNRASRASHPRLLLVCLAVAGLSAPAADATEARCATPCEARGVARAASGGDCGAAVACGLSGRALRRATPAGPADFSALAERATAAKARRQAALRAARGELLERQRKAHEARDVERAQRERTQQQVLARSGLRKANLVGESLTQPGGAAGLFPGFQFSGVDAAMDRALDAFLQQIDPTDLPIHDRQPPAQNADVEPAH